MQRFSYYHHHTAYRLSCFIFTYCRSPTHYAAPALAVFIQDSTFITQQRDRDPCPILPARYYDDYQALLGESPGAIDNHKGTILWFLHNLSSKSLSVVVIPATQIINIVLNVGILDGTGCNNEDDINTGEPLAFIPLVMSCFPSYNPFLSFIPTINHPLSILKVILTVVEYLTSRYLN